MDHSTEIFEDDGSGGDDPRPPVSETAAEKFAATAGARYADGWILAGMCSPRPGVIVATFHRSKRKGNPG